MASYNAAQPMANTVGLHELVFRTGNSCIEHVESFSHLGHVISSAQNDKC